MEMHMVHLNENAANKIAVTAVLYKIGKPDRFLSKAVLEDAEQKQLKDKAIQNWLQKLNAAAYEVDDIFDECQTVSTRFKQSLLGRCDPGVITFRFKMAKRMKEVMEKLDAIAEERSKFHYLRENIVERESIRPESGYILTEPEIYGRDRELNEIVKILLNNANDAEELSVLPIIGIGGLGKTTLAQMVFNDERVIEHFNLRIWICVSDDFDEKRLIKAMIEYIEEKLLGNMDLALLQKKLKELLNEKRHLLILDDVWNEDQEKWAKLRGALMGGASGASVVITTRLEKVGSIMGTVQPYHLSNLSQEDCWSLFMQRAFGDKMEANPSLVAIGTKIVKKCCGVPLAAKTLGSLLRFKREESQWKHVRDSELWNLSQDETSILAALRLSYQNLPLDLRQCFLYCAKFRKDAKMEKENLITLWMAHGFLLSKGNLELEDVGNEVWEELYLRSFFQEIEKGKSGVTYFKMHDLIHDLASSMISTTTPSNQVRQAKVIRMNIFIGLPGAEPSYTFPKDLKKFSSLRVLHMRFSNMDNLSSSIGDLIHLRLLDMSGTNVRTLPERLCNLQNLQTLYLSNCYSLSCLPTQMSKLSSLRILELKSCHNLASMPPRIGSLTCLRILRYFIVGERKGYRLSELGNLNQLRGSLSIEHLERVKNVNDAKEANLSRKDLHDLYMSWDRGDDKYESEDMDEKVLEALTPHPSLKFLKIRGFRGLRFPSWMNGSLLQKMVSVEVEGCKRCSRLPLFGNMPCLETFSLSDGSADLEYVEEDFYSEFPTIRFPSLRELYIREFPNLKGLIMKREEKEQFPKLEKISLCKCPMLIFPTLPSVKRLYIPSDTDATSLSSIHNLRNLTYLDITSNEATSFPDEMFQGLVKLETLNILLCRSLKELPSSLASLNALKFFTINRCTALECLPEQGLEGLTSLTELFVRNCDSLKSLSEGLQHLTALTRLVVSGCRELVALPEGIRNLHSLKVLDISYCAGLQPVEASIRELKNNMQDLQINFTRIPVPEEHTALYKEE